MYFKLTLTVLSLAAIVASSEVRAEDADEGWDISLAAGLNATDGNSDTLLTTLGLSAQKEEGHNILHLGVDAAYGETTVPQDDGTEIHETTAQNAKVFINYKRTKERSYSYLDASIAHDDIAEVDYRASAGPGVGTFFIKEDTRDFSAEIGPSYIYEKVAGVEDDYLAIRISERAEWKLSDTSKIWETAEYLPAAEDFNDYLWIAEVGAEASLNALLSLRVVVQDTYDSTPAEGQEENDITITAALVYQL